ncbi:16S rRNA (cytosine(1402)-N(4))-methyltransferase RsmH [Mycoplasmatota bacterium]|nr:16S rRNA (cytosine(1402)-N(4))-methyltransferase RsmH [Mycoplasmatota bacterium]
MYRHISVLLNEAIENLNIKTDGIYVDCTLGGGGHSSEILKKITNGHLYCFDQDDYAIEVAKEKLSKISNNYTIIRSNFVNIKEKLKELGIERVDGILYDLGVSSFHFDIPERGFSYHLEAELDMRMDQNQEISALTIVNQYSLSELISIFSKYGEITYSKRLAEAIIKARNDKVINTTKEFVDIILNATPAAIRRKGHPAKKVFQAIRIAVNNELDVFQKSLESSLSILRSKGRVVVISFHSLEDRIAKRTFNNAVKVDIPKGLPIREAEIPREYKIITKKPIIPSIEEISNNSRAHSAKLRVIEKL